MEQFKDHGKNTPEFSLLGLSTLARVVSVYDGDTISVVIPFTSIKEGDEIFYKYSIRILGIDTAEIHNTNLILKNIAKKTRKRVLELIGCLDDDLENKLYGVFIECKEYDKYGRLLADVYTINEANECKKCFLISKILIKENLAYEYSGGKKLSPDEQLLLFNKNS